MRPYFLSAVIFFSLHAAIAQGILTPEILWQLGRINPEAISADMHSVIYTVTNYDTRTGASSKVVYSMPATGGNAVALPKDLGGISNVENAPDKKMAFMKDGQIWVSEWDGNNARQVSNFKMAINGFHFSPDGRRVLVAMDTKTNLTISDIYPDMTNANVKMYESLDYRHWDTWEDDNTSHIYYGNYSNSVIGDLTDIMIKEPYDVPQMPFGGMEDAIWSPDGSAIIYVCKKKSGTAYTVSTNTDIYSFDIRTGKTFDLTTANKGYDISPELASNGGMMAWLSMEREGYESDKQRLMVINTKTGRQYDATKNFDESVESFAWSADGTHIYFIAPVDGTLQLFSVPVAPEVDPNAPVKITQLTKGDFDINHIVGQSGPEDIIVTRCDMNHANELYDVSIATGQMKQITFINKQIYDNLSMSKTERKMVKTTDGKDMLVWFIYPPDFNPAKKYPTLLYCQGGPQSALTQFYSFRWNFQLMAANGYIVVAPNRRGMPGHGTQWNEEISKDWGGQAIKDYYAAIDYAKTLPYVDGSRCAAVGASYGGYSVYMMAGTHEGRFKTFIAHDGLFNLESFYGTTDEMWFANWDLGGPYWENGVQNKSYQDFNPINFVKNWNTPILIYQGGKDYRTTEDQAFQAFQAAQLKGIKSRFVYFPDENHWISKCQDGLVWQKEFYRWLRETL